ncbi:MAG TPA: hypothetical protein VMV59_10510 [Candidatus Dormibacteraeota bacterium]|nr:hypothetical protein [Candidatus Dormibacteraeota bacterium]
MRKLLICASVLAIGFFANGPSASAQEESEPILYTYVALWNVPRPQWGGMDQFAQSMTATLDKLVDDGTLTGYGSADPVVHTENGPTHEDWMQATSVAGILRALDAIKEADMASAVLANARHQDLFLRSTIHRYKAGTYQHAYLWVGSFAIKPGHVEDWSQNFKTYMAPELDKLVEDGTLAGYQLDTQLVHEGDTNTLDYAFVTTHADGIDKVQAMIRQVEEKNPAIGGSFDSWEQDKGHSDSIALVTMMKTK